MLNPFNFELLNVNVSREIFITQDFSFVSTGFHFYVRACFAQATLDEISQDLHNSSEQQLQNDAALQTVSRPASCVVLHWCTHFRHVLCIGIAVCLPQAPFSCVYKLRLTVAVGVKAASNAASVGLAQRNS